MRSPLYEFFRDQGSIIAGLLALLAGLLAYRAGRVQAMETRQAAIMQVDAARRRDDREVDALRKSLGTELRIVVPRVLGIYESLNRLAHQTGPITARTIENLSSMPTPGVYRSSVAKIGLLGSDAMDVMIVYSLIEAGRDGVTRLMFHRTPDNIRPELVAAIAEAFFQACFYARGVLPKVKTGVASHDDRDAELIQKIEAAKPN